MTAVGIGLIGCGWMGELHSAALLRVRRHFPECRAEPRLVIAADEVAERAEAAVLRLGFAQATDAALAVIAHPDVDAISIATPNHLHLPLALAAVAAGKPFWIEKPVGRFPGETARIAAAAATAGVATTVGYNYRQAPAVARARELIAAGEIGEVRTYRGRFLVDYASRPDRALSWRFTREAAGLGVLGDLMSHTVDMTHHLAGPIAAVSAQRAIDIPRRPIGAGQFSVVEGAELGTVENEDYAMSLARLAGGGRAIFEVSRTMVGAHCQMAFEVHGTEGALAWDFERLNELRRFRGGADPGWTTVHARPGHGEFGRFQPDAAVAMGFDDLKVIEAHTFLESVLDGGQRAPGVAEAVAVAEVLSAMERSCESGAWEDVAPLAVQPEAAP